MAEQESRLERYKRLAEQRMSLPTGYLAELPPLGEDTLWRGLTRRGEIRLLVARTTNTATEAARRLESSADVAKLLAEWTTATLLVRSTLNPEERMQVFLNHQGPVGQVVVDAWENGGVRCFVQRPQEEEALFGFLIGEGNMQVSRSNEQRAKAYRSTVELRGDGTEAFMMHYLLDSEQILSLLKVEAVVEQGVLRSAVGYLVQLLPEGSRDDLQKLLDNLTSLPSLSAAMTPEDPDGRAWAEQLLAGFPWDQCARESVAYQCRCSEDRILAMIGALPRADIESLAQGDEPLEMTCDYCREKYAMHPSRLNVLLEAPS
jgi:molecular chaperone Hsp33